MRICILKATGQLIEAQSGGDTPAHLDTLRQNALAAGYAENEIEVKYGTADEFKTALALAPKPAADPAALTLEKIDARLKAIEAK